MPEIFYRENGPSSKITEADRQAYRNMLAKTARNAAQRQVNYQTQINRFRIPKASEIGDEDVPYSSNFERGIFQARGNSINLANRIAAEEAAAKKAEEIAREKAIANTAARKRMFYAKGKGGRRTKKHHKKSHKKSRRSHRHRSA
jgi:hypothetical protein